VIVVAEELLAEREVEVDPVTVYRWAQFNLSNYTEAWRQFRSENELRQRPLDK
jgi:transposase-like protein